MSVSDIFCVQIDRQMVWYECAVQTLRVKHHHVLSALCTQAGRQTHRRNAPCLGCSLTISVHYTHTHTHTHRERERETFSVCVRARPLSAPSLDGLPQ